MVFLAALGLPACFVHHRVIPPPGKVQNRPLLTATKDELIARIHRIADPIQSFNLRADMAPSVGSLYGGELTDYATIRAYLLFRKPDDIRVIGLDPIVHAKTIFDMLSSGNNFRVYIPSRDAFYVGDNNAPPSSKNKFENLRPSAFLTSLIVEPTRPSDRTLIEEETDESKAEYILHIIREEQGELHLVRAVYFDRYTLEISRQKTVDAAGEIISETRYADWKDYEGIKFPSEIVIRRPKDGYEVTMTVVSMKFNPTDLGSAQFVLEQPVGARLTEIK
ncbi:MAG TPA: hypothetical protein VNX18_20330 [Bryobacteraceae bacterium]|nr:hypothetical protein [Bryobacteraceae bacterium]